ncbi:UNVERIFIED_CONTAM: hypothetical protein Sradi_1901000 [Sesamum radiatum]|uniref:Uncharacterized protein n=1 Tax=Sesamum radiatum TaxID=300843 RepID=A0AAW2U1I5_SESRA
MKDSTMSLDIEFHNHEIIIRSTRLHNSKLGDPIVGRGKLPSMKPSFIFVPKDTYTARCQAKKFVPSNGEVVKARFECSEGCMNNTSFILDSSFCRSMSLCCRNIHFIHNAQQQRIIGSNVTISRFNNDMKRPSLGRL